jgi:hypothetical protein
MTQDKPGHPAAKIANYTAFILAEKRRLLYDSKQNLKVNAKDGGHPLAAEVNANVQQYGKHTALHNVKKVVPCRDYELFYLRSFIL